MRIIAGEMRSRRLKAPAGMDTRPTADRVKEALFSILGARVYGARVPDLYADSGALALEALSRGAEYAVLCDCGREACRVIRENIADLGCEQRARLMQMRDTAALETLKKNGESFDLIFLDPPYRMDTTPVMAEIAARGLVKPHGVIVAEYRENMPGTPEGFAVWKDRRVGSVFVRMYRKEETEG